MRKEVPTKLRPFIQLGFDYHESRVNGKEAYGDCVFCDAHNKFYVNTDSSMWECKSGKCQSRGNVYSFLTQWHKMKLLEQEAPLMLQSWKALSDDRKIPVQRLKREQLVTDAGIWYIPVRNASGSIVTFRSYKLGDKLKGLADMESGLFGAEQLADDGNISKDVLICEGEWDAIAARDLLEKEEIPVVVVASPGCSVWKDGWTDQINGRSVTICYDNDDGGKKGLIRVWGKIRTRASSLRRVVWPDELPDGFDLRDFVTGGGSWAELGDDVSADPPSSPEKPEPDAKEPEVRTPLPLSEPGDRPKFEQVIEVFNKHLYVSEDMVTALRIIFAVVLSNQIDGDPLWMHIVSPPGTAKTELLMPLSDCPSCYFASTLTAHSLVSGFVTANGKDPSLLPKLNGKTFILKDFTEILGMPKVQKDEIYSTLRGAYDGSVQKHYGNGQEKNYKIRFNMLSGVTHSVFGERGASLGERFLLFHLVKGVGFSSDKAIESAINNVGKEVGVRHDLHAVVRQFVERPIPHADIQPMSHEMVSKIIALSNIVSILRASVDKAFAGGQEKVLYRPQHEMGTRVGKQLTKLAYGLSLVNTPVSLGEKEYDIVRRVAMDTCVGFNMDLLTQLVIGGGNKPIDELAEAANIPITTLRDQLEDLRMLGAIEKKSIPNPHGKGAPKHLYSASPSMVSHWRNAGLLPVGYQKKKKSSMRVVIKK